ncbi:hypothetical protein CCDG5_1304 [[Clostridium] cellulosi]|uniref:Uncharacterized protein n=1 Tax=[Clostridium] cellulosi TaxID=29343 RepID=A0A078KPS8_9FIRM|nr:hypothetical protein CCDG5_1304 [[Clostridium] cellulosi]
MMASSIDFPFVKCVDLCLCAQKGDFASRDTFEKLDTVFEGNDRDTIILPVTAWQENVLSTDIVYSTARTPGDWEIENMIDYIHKKGFRVLFKPMLKLNDGKSCEEIDFSGSAESEALWDKWFKNYAKFIFKMAGLAQRTGCSFFSVGSRFSQSENREKQWRWLIDSVRNIFSGYITYEIPADREENLPWLDALDFLSVHINNTPAQFERIKRLASEYNKPYVLYN